MESNFKSNGSYSTILHYAIIISFIYYLRTKTLFNKEFDIYDTRLIILLHLLSSIEMFL